MNKLLVSTAAVLAALTSAASAATITAGGFTFEEEDFADALVSFTPGVPAATDPNYTDPSEAVGAPDYSNPTGSVSLGRGGEIVLRFTDNALSGSGDADPDLYIFEIGPDVEDTSVFISRNGTDFFSVGKVSGSTSTIDIDPFLIAQGLDPFTRFSFVKLIDDPDEGQRTGSTVGADIDAIGALSSAPPAPEVPIPGAAALFVPALAGLRFLRGRRKA